MSGANPYRNGNYKATYKKNRQIIYALILLFAVMAVGFYFLAHSVQLQFYWMLGIVFGFVLQRSRFCFAAAFRDPFITGITTIARAVSIAFGVAVAGVAVIKYVRPDIAMVNVHIIGVPLMLGAVFFGIGMVIAGGCASGTLMRVGEGFTLQMVALVFFIVGSVWGAHDMGVFWSRLNVGMPKVFLPDAMGWFGALAVQYGLIALLYFAAFKWQEKKIGKVLLEKPRFFVSTGDNSLRLQILKAPITYSAGAVLLAVGQIMHFVLLDRGWSITTAFTKWGIGVYQAVGGDVNSWDDFTGYEVGKFLSNSFWSDGGSVHNAGIVVGAFMAALFASQFKLKRIKSVKQLSGTVLGALLMGYGARLAYGCNIGALFTAISALSLSGWVFCFFLLIGAFLGSKLLIKFFV